MHRNGTWAEIGYMGKNSGRYREKIGPLHLGNLDHENVKICAELAFQIVLASKDNRGLKKQHAPSTIFSHRQLKSALNTYFIINCFKNHVDLRIFI